MPVFFARRFIAHGAAAGAMVKEALLIPNVRALARELLSHTIAGEFARYFAAGLLALVVDFCLYVALTEVLGWHYLASATVAFCAGLATIYLLSIRWIFRQRRVERSAHEFALFAAIGAAGLLLTAL